MSEEIVVYDERYKERFIINEEELIEVIKTTEDENMNRIKKNK